MQSCDCRRILRAMVRMTLMLVAINPLQAQAPTETPAHRVLELPRNGSADLQQQMFLLKQLQSMLGGKQPDSSSEKAKSFKPEQLQNLKRMFEQFGGVVPAGMRAEDIPPELIEQVNSDPQLKRQVQEMLKQFKRDGQLPQSDGLGGSRLPLPPNTGQQNLDSSMRPANRRRDPRNPQPLQPPEVIADAQPPASPGRSDALKKLEELWNNANPNSSRPNSNPPDNIERSQSGGARPNEPFPSQPADSSNRPSAPGAPQTMPETPEGWDKLLQDLIKQQRDSTGGNPSDTDTPLGATGSGVSPGRQPQSGQASGRRGDKLSVQEFLEQMQGVVPPDSSPSGKSEKSDSANAANEGAATEAARQKVRRKQEQTSETLRDKGLKATLKSIYADARKQAKEEQAKEEQARAIQSGDPAQSGAGEMSSSLMKAIDGIRKDVFEMVKDGDIKFGGDTGNGDSEPRSSSRMPPPQKSESMLGGFKDVANELISDLSAPEPPTAAAPSSSEMSSPMSFGRIVIPLLLVALIAGLIAWRTGLLDVTGLGLSAQRTISSAEICNKADVVEAFHSMALKPVRKTQAWWTHQMVTQEIVEQSPEKTYQVSVLAELYECARYLPDDQDFTPEQILEARRALQLCEER